MISPFQPNTRKIRPLISMKKTAILLATLGLGFSALSAQTVPEFLNYQGTVTDSAGLGLGDSAPVNRKVLFRVYDTATGNNLIWTEEQTVTISKGQFSVLLGQGIQFASEAHDSLLDVFGNGPTGRYLAITVDNGDGTLNASDLPITPRQRITSTAYSFRAGTADSIASGSSLQLDTSDSGLGYFDAGRTFGGFNMSGPVLYGAGGGALGAKTGATETSALRWDSAGNVGIGTNSPLNGKKLHVVGDSYFDGQVEIGSASQQNPVKIVSATATALTIQSPTAGGYGLKHTNGASSFETWVSPGQANLESNGALHLRAATSLSLFANNSTNARFVVNSLGNVGIGTSSPTQKLDVNGSVRGSFIVRQLGSYVPGSIYSDSGWGMLFRSATASPTTTFSFADFNDVKLMTIKPNGNVGIGTTTPDVKLEVIGSAKIGGAANGSRFLLTGNQIQQYQNGTPAMMHLNLAGGNISLNGGSNAGNVGIGTTSPSDKLDVVGGVRATGFRSTNGGYTARGDRFDGIKWTTNDSSDSIAAHIFRFGSTDGRLLFTNNGAGNTTGVYLAVGGTSFTSTSDERLKLDIEPITSILEKIKDIRVVGYNMASTSIDVETGEMKVDFNTVPRTTNNGTVIKQEIGSIAQDWTTSFPELVVEPKSADQYYGLNYDRIGVVALGAVQELNQIVTQQSAEIASLKSELGQLKAKNVANDARLAAIEQLLSAQ